MTEQPTLHRPLRHRDTHHLLRHHPAVQLTSVRLRHLWRRWKIRCSLLGQTSLRTVCKKKKRNKSIKLTNKVIKKESKKKKEKLG